MEPQSIAPELPGRVKNKLESVRVALAQKLLLYITGKIAARRVWERYATWESTLNHAQNMQTERSHKHISQIFFAYC